MSKDYFPCPAYVIHFAESIPAGTLVAMFMLAVITISLVNEQVMSGSLPIKGDNMALSDVKLILGLPYIPSGNLATKQSVSCQTLPALCHSLE